MAADLVRTNWCPDPRATGAAPWYASGNPIEYVVADDGPPLPDGNICRTYARTALTWSGSGPAPGPGITPAIDGEVRLRGGDQVGLSLWIRVPRLVERVNLTATFYPPTGSTGSRVAAAPEEFEVPANTWTRVTGVVTVPSNPDGWSAMYYFPRLTGMTAGDLVDVSLALTNFSGGTDWFDGDMPDTDAMVYAWTGTPNASPSTATDIAVTITATLMTTSQRPRPVQVVLSNIPDGVAYHVTGIGTGGRTWAIAGGVGVSEGKQIVLIDNRAPLNMPIRYRLVTAAGAVDSNTLTSVQWAPEGASGKFLVQSLDGSVVVPIAAWIDNQLPKDPVLHAAAFDVRGRRRPVMVLTAAGDGTTTVTWRLARNASTALEKILADGGGLVIRTDGSARDLPASDVAVITSATNALWRGHHGVSTDRVWDIELTWIDDPEPSSVPVVWSVDQVDALLAGRTVEEVDTMFAHLNVDQVDALDFGELTDPDMDVPVIEGFDA